MGYRGLAGFALQRSNKGLCMEKQYPVYTVSKGRKKSIGWVKKLVKWTFFIEKRQLYRYTFLFYTYWANEGQI